MLNIPRRVIAPGVITRLYARGAAGVVGPPAAPPPRPPPPPPAVSVGVWGAGVTGRVGAGAAAGAGAGVRAQLAKIAAAVSETANGVNLEFMGGEGQNVGTTDALWR
ncbi:MAG: hypothetical protein ABJB74_07115 [Gemmatimonas sp.]